MGFIVILDTIKVENYVFEVADILFMVFIFSPAIIICHFNTRIRVEIKTLLKIKGKSIC